MKRSKTFMRIDDWDTFWGMWLKINEHVRGKAEQLVIDERLAEMEGSGHGFGSSDRNHTIFGAFTHADYDETNKAEPYSVPTTAEEMEERAKRFIHDHCVNVLGQSENMVNCFLSDPDGYARMFAPAE